MPLASRWLPVISHVLEMVNIHLLCRWRRPSMFVLVPVWDSLPHVALSWQDVFQPKSGFASVIKSVLDQQAEEFKLRCGYLKAEITF